MGLLWVSLFFVQATLFLGCCGEKWHLYQHYVHKGCTPDLDDQGQPIRFRCGEMTDEIMQSCYHGDQWYRLGEKVQLNKCEDCQCRASGVRGAALECPEVDCPDWNPKNKSCYMGYKGLDECCPTEICPKGNQEKEMCQGKNGVSYRPGTYMPADSDEPCQHCICREGAPWCRKLQCPTALNAPEIRQGCLVVYSEKGCCDVGTHCGPIYGAKPLMVFPENTEDLCHYRGQYFAKGSQGKLKDFPYGCVECECSVPPDFTCIRKPCN